MVECKHLLSHILVTNPTARATLAEVMNHPWMMRGSPGPPDPHLVHREPLRPEELDKNVLRGMKGFGFGTEEEIERKLVEVLESNAYHRAVQYWKAKRGIGNVPYWKAKQEIDAGRNEDSTASTPQKSKGFSGFDFYRRKLFSQTPPPSDPQSHLSRDETHEPADPAYGFHPLISIYFLAREKIERDRTYGQGLFASSQLSLATSNTVVDNDTGVRTENDSTHPTEPTEQSPGPPIMVTTTEPIPVTKADSSMPLPRLPAPESSHYSGLPYEPTVLPPPTTQVAHIQPEYRDLADLSIKQPHATSDQGVQPPPSPNKSSVSALQPSTVPPTLDSSILLNCDGSACRRLISHARDAIPLIREIFANKDELQLINDLRGDDAQTFIDAIHRVRLNNSSFLRWGLIASIPFQTFAFH